MTTLSEFFAAFFPDEAEPISLRALKAKGAPDATDNRPLVEVVRRRRLATDTTLQESMIAANTTRGWYFVVNTGGNADVEISRFNAFFAENDDLSISEQHKRLDEAPLQPSIRLETKKSVHAHWLMKGSCDADAWRDVQERLIGYFDSDVNIKNPSRVMRIPFFNHVHYDAQTGVYEYKRVELHTFLRDTRFTLDEMQAAFPQVSQPLATASNIVTSAHGPNLSSQVGEMICIGSRHKALVSLAGSMRRRGLGQAEMFAALKITNQLRCQPPLNETEVSELCHDVARRYSPMTPSIPADGLSSASGISTRSKEFSFTSLGRLLAEPEEDVSFVWEKTLPVGGFSVCSAKPKVGKSTLARNLAHAVSRGDPFLGRQTVMGKVLYLCLEEKRAEIIKLFRRMGASDDDIQIAFVTPQDALTALELAVAGHEPALTIIDPLSRLVRVRDFNEYGPMIRALEPFIDLARKSACHILALHHDGKGERVGGDALLGSTALFGAVDCHIQLKKRERARTILTTQRYGVDLPETVVELDAETGLIREQGDLQAVLQADKEAEILAAMSDTEELTEVDVKERIGGNQGLISKAIRLLVSESKLARNGAGKKGNPYTYCKFLTNLGNLTYPDDETSDSCQESGVSSYIDIEEPRNLESSETDSSGLSSEQLFNVSPKPVRTEQSSVAVSVLCGYQCWTCSASVSDEDAHCPNCDQNLRFDNA